METIEFKATIDAEQVIRPPAGVSIPQGEVEVVVRVKSDVAGSSPPMHGWMLEMAERMKALNPDLPADLAENHDHYLHGTPRRE